MALTTPESSRVTPRTRPPSSPLALFTHIVTQPQNATVNPCPAVPTWCLIRAGAVCQNTLFDVPHLRIQTTSFHHVLPM